MIRLRTLSGTIAGLLLGATLLPAADPPYMIYFKDGKRIEAKAAPVVKGDNATFTTASGQEFTVKAERINLEGSAVENARRKAAFEKSGIVADDNPLDSSLGSLSSKRAPGSGDSQTVTQTDLERTSGNDLNSINPIVTRAAPAAGNDQPATADTGNAGSQTVSGPGGQTATINYQIQVNPQVAAPAAPGSAPAPAPAEQK